MGKIIRIEENIDRYMKLADKKMAEDDLLGALFTLKSLEKLSRDLSVTARLADVYADMGLLDISNRYWYKYMNTAPKEKVSTAYEELGINYFYMDNLWATGYYFHKKIQADGYISKEGIDNEIIEFLSGDEFKKYAYRVVYPPERADFSLEHKSGKRAIALGAFSEAVKMLEKIPKRNRTEEIADDLSVAYFMSDDLENAEKEVRRALKEHGESVWAYCNLSTVYELKKDYEKSEYYYQKALSLATGERIEAYKIMTCAIERKDHYRVKECLEKVIEERPYEIAMLYFYGIALINLGDYESAKNALKKARSLDFDDVIVEYYYNLAKAFCDGEGEQKLLPLDYEKRLPKLVEKRWTARIKHMIDDPKKFVAGVKKKDNKSLFKWCMLYGSDSSMRTLTYNMATLTSREFIKLAIELLMMPEANDALKRLLVYMLAMSGYKGKISVVFGVFFKTYHGRKTACEKDLDNPKFLTAYALAMSKLVFSDIEDIDVIAKSIDRVYFSLKDKIDDSVTVEELGALTIYCCDYKGYTDLNKICTQFHCDAKKVESLKQMMGKVKEND